LINDVSQGTGDRRRRSAGAAALAAAAITAGALAGCGGGGGTTTGSQPSTSAGGTGTSTSAEGTTTSTGNVFGSGGAAKGHTVSDVLNAVLTSGDPDKACGTDYVTEQYLSRAYGGEQGCVDAQTGGSAAQSVQIEGLASGSQPDTASVKIVPKGGVYSGEKLTVTMVKEGDDWKIDAVKSNAPVGP
jgi:hypothetical protein